MQGRKSLEEKLFTNFQLSDRVPHDNFYRKLKESCIGKSPEKKIVDTSDKAYYDKMHERMQTPYARKMKKLRQCTVEPVLGTLINFLGMKRINTRGIKLANKCMIMAAIAYNIKKMIRFSKPRVLSKAMVVDPSLFLNSLRFSFF